MEKLNVLTWKKNLYLEADTIANDCIEFAFKIDGFPMLEGFEEFVIQTKLWSSG